MFGDSVAPLRKLLGILLAVAIAWFLFEVAIQPALVSISPIFADQPLSSGETNVRRIDSVAQLAFVVTLLLGVFMYFVLKVLVFEGADESIEMILGFCALLVLLPIGIVKNDILPVFGVDRWESDPTQDDSQDDGI